MGEENILVKESKDNKPSSGDNKKRSKRCEEPFPPKLSRLRRFFLFCICYPALLLASLYIVEQFCSIHTVSWVVARIELLKEVCRPCVWATYIAFGVMIAVLIIDRMMQHNLIIHNARREDISEVEALFVEAQTVELQSNGPMANHDYFSQKKDELLEEVKRLKDEVGNRGWTEYQVLSLNQMVVEFLEADELIARAQSSLEDLEDYAENKDYGGYDRKQYDNWKNRINEAIEELDKADNESKRNAAIKMLQARLETLLEHVASYNAKWSEGTAILSGIRKCAILTIFLLFPMSLLPTLHPAGVGAEGGALSFLNWGLLGIIGAIIAVLLSLRKSDYVEVGNTEGKKEFWRAFGGTVLGFAAGILAYWMFAGGLFTEGSVVPTLGSSQLRDIGLSIVWAVASGFCFEKVFDRMISTTLGGS